MHHIKHSDLANFADDKVNLKKKDVDDQRAEINNLRERIDKKIADEPGYGIYKILNAGSVAKGTAISRGSDRDLAVYVREENVPDDMPGLVVWIRDRVREAYPELPDDGIKAGANCVEVILPSGLKVDVVPILYSGDPNDIGDLVRKGSGRKVRTSVRLHLDFIRDRKKKYPHLAQHIRFTKWWVQHQRDRDRNFKCKSFMVELIWIWLADNGRLHLDDHVLALEDFFDFVANGGLDEQIAFTDYLPASSLPARGNRPIQVLDPVNFDNNVGARYETADREKLEAAASHAYEAISTAHYVPVADEAEGLWQAVMGRTFSRSAA